MKNTLVNTMKKKTTPSITKGDFDEAVSHRFSYKKCLVAHMMMRIGIKVKTAIHPIYYSKTGAAKRARATFGEHFYYPGDENKPELQALRASLPIKVKI